MHTPKCFRLLVEHHKNLSFKGSVTSSYRLNPQHKENARNLCTHCILTMAYKTLLCFYTIHLIDCSFYVKGTQHNGRVSHTQKEYDNMVCAHYINNPN